MLHTLVLLLSFSSSVFAIPSFQRLPLPPRGIGPEAFAFDSSGGGPYTGVSDGKILKYGGPVTGFVEFASTTSPANKLLCNGTISSFISSVCGRPLGIAFNKVSELYIADANLGLCVAPRAGGQANCIVKSAEGLPFRFLDGLDIDPTTGVIYVTDFSSVFNLSQELLAILSNDATGRLLSYDPKNQKVTVLLRGLSGAGGVAVSRDGSFLLVTEFLANRIRRYWIKGPRANTNMSEIFIRRISKPDNIKRMPSGDFWVATNEFTPLLVPTAVRINPLGLIVEKVPLAAQLGATLVSEVNDFANARYVGSMFTNFVGKFTL